MLFKPNSPNTAAWQVWAVSIGLAGITWLVFGQTLQYDFINYDDPVYISKNPQVTAGITSHGVVWAFKHIVSSNWHPLTIISHMLDCQLYGLDAGGHHATNVLLHMLAAIFLFLVLRQMTTGASRTGNVWPSAFVAALFAIHPLRAESVAWIAERKDVLSAVFFMLTLAAYLHYVRKTSLASYLTLVLVFILGLLSKPMLVTTPFVLLLLDYWPLQRFATEPTTNVESSHRLNRSLIVWRLIWEKVPLLLLSSVACGIAVIAQQGYERSLQSVPVWLRIYNAVQSYCIYIRKIVWPGKLGLIYPYPTGALPAWKGLLGIALLGCLTYYAWVLRRKAPYLVTGWLWYLGMLVPVIGLVQVGMQARADRYTYLPQIGLTMALTWAIVDFSASWQYRREILASTAIPVILALAWCAEIQTSYWKDSESIWRHSLAVNPNNSIAHYNLGHFLLKDGRADEGIFHLQEEDGRADEGIFHLQEALRISPADPRIHTRLGTALLYRQRVAEAIDHYEHALAVAPHSIEVLNILAFLLSASPEGRFRDGQRAVRLAELADQLSDNKNPLVARTLAAAYAESGRFNDAIVAGERALKLAIAQNNAGLAAELKIDLDLYQMNRPRRGRF
jgi:Tfp pilus assembly protein PilF